MNNNTYIEVTGYSGSTQITLESRFLKERKVFLQGPITAETANDLVMKLMYMEKDDSNEPVRLYVNSPGGEVNGGLLIYDMLQSMTKPVEIYCAGMAASMAAIILASGGKGRRHILPHSRVMIHEPLLDGDLEAQPHQSGIFPNPLWRRKGSSTRSSRNTPEERSQRLKRRLLTTTI